MVFIPFYEEPCGLAAGYINVKNCPLSFRSLTPQQAAANALAIRFKMVLKTTSITRQITQKRYFENTRRKPYFNNHLTAFNPVIYLKKVFSSINEGPIEGSYFITNNIPFFIED